MNYSLSGEEMESIDSISSERTSNVRITLSQGRGAASLQQCSVHLLHFSSCKLTAKYHCQEVVPVLTSLLSVEWWHFLARVSFWAMAALIGYAFRAFTCCGLCQRGSILYFNKDCMLISPSQMSLLMSLRHLL